MCVHVSQAALQCVDEGHEGRGTVSLAEASHASSARSVWPGQTNVLMILAVRFEGSDCSGFSVELHQVCRRWSRTTLSVLLLARVKARYDASIPH